MTFGETSTGETVRRRALIPSPRLEFGFLDNNKATFAKVLQVVEYMTDKTPPLAGHGSRCWSGIPRSMLSEFA